MKGVFQDQDTAPAKEQHRERGAWNGVKWGQNAGKGSRKAGRPQVREGLLGHRRDLTVGVRERYWSVRSERTRFMFKHITLGACLE